MRRVLFLCVGNSCRSQMAEGFARKYGPDVMEPVSAGLSPATIIQPLTRDVMQMKNINIDDQYPKDLISIDVATFDLIINMSGMKLPVGIPVEVRDWKIEDPIGRSEEVYIAVREKIEHLVMSLILEFRREAHNGDGSSKPTVVGPTGRRARVSGSVAPKPSPQTPSPQKANAVRKDSFPPKPR